MSVLKVKNVWKMEENKALLKDITLFVEPNEWLLITGPTNEGKECLKKIFSGFDRDYQGRIFLNGENIKEIDKYETKVSFIHNHLVYEQLPQSVFEYITFPLVVKGLPVAEIFKVITKMIANLTLSLDMNKSMKELLLQERVIAAFLRAAITHPEIIILDEPFYQLVNSERKLVLETLKHISERWNGTPVIIFSSYFMEWTSICHRLAIIHRQTLMQIGMPEQLRTNPQSVFVATFCADSSFSFLKGRILNGYFHSDGITFSFPENFFVDKPFYEGQEIIIGIASQSFDFLSSETECQSLGVTMNVFIHILTREKDDVKIFFNIGGQPLVAQIKNNGKMNEGDALMLFVPYKKLLFFEGNTEKRLL